MMQFHHIIIEPHYFPCLEYFQVLTKTPEADLEVCQNFEKQNYNNRCQILSSNGVLPLIIPLHKSSKLPYKEIKIDYSQKWTQNHIAAIQSAYGKSPFFEHFGPTVISWIEKKPGYLQDLNLNILSNCLEIIGLETKLSCTSTYENPIGNGITDLRSAIHPKKPSILEKDLPTISYTQVFGSKFVKNLSILDLLFCEGPNAGYLLGGNQD